MNNKEAIEQLKQIPINPEASDEYIRTIYQAIDMAIEALKERPTGEWIKHSTYKDVLICSNCNHGSNQVYDTFNFCPNCGAENK